jgi:diguanylate cyclase (GGDEF)-like protein
LKDFTSLIHSDDKEKSSNEFEKHLAKIQPYYSVEMQIKCNDSRYKYFLVRGKVTARSGDEKPLRMIATCEDITETKNAEAEILKHANYDSLTGLPNRRMLYNRLSYKLNGLNSGNDTCGLFILDLDKFKYVNDSLGHDYGDMLLKDVSQRIVDCVKQSDTVSRLGGDEFAVILTDFQSNAHVEDTASKIIKALKEPFELHGHTVYISASLGITLAPTDSMNIDTLFRYADQAMYKAKVNGRNRYSFFTQSLQLEAEKRAILIQDLRNALINNEFELYYQPIVNLHLDVICKAEALLRWHHPTRGMISPLDFIPLAEETGLINEIGNWVLIESAKQAKKFTELYTEDFQVSVNISPVQFMSRTDKVTQEYKDFLDLHDVSGKNIVMEITENLLLDSDSEVENKLLWLKDNGIEIAIDDFGTGYSSLAYLRKFNIDYLKIDKVFIDNIETDKDDFHICEAIILMAHTLGLKVIAEGVETKVQKHILCDMGCDFGQGYFFSKPIQVKDFEGIAELVLG